LSTQAARSTTAPAGASERLRLLIAVLIALASILGAGSVWLAVRASIQADELDRAGFRQTAADVQIRTGIFQAHIAASLVDYAYWLSHDAQARALNAAAGNLTGSALGQLRLEAKANRSAARSSWLAIDGPARGRKEGRLTLIRAERTAYLQERADRKLDLNPSPEFHQSNRMRTKAERLAGLAALFLVAALLFTLAQLLRRRAFRLPLWLGLINLSLWTVVALVVQFTT
jgi:hypothetical protein